MLQSTRVCGDVSNSYAYDRVNHELQAEKNMDWRNKDIGFFAWFQSVKTFACIQSFLVHK